MSSKWKINRKVKKKYSFYSKYLYSDQETVEHSGSKAIPLEKNANKDELTEDVTPGHNNLIENVCCPASFPESPLVTEDDSQCIEVDAHENAEENTFNHGMNVDEGYSASLKRWAIKHNITHLALNELLVIVRDNFDSSTPVDSRTFLNTPKSCKISSSIISIAGGKYFHFTLKDSLLSILNKIFEHDCSFFESVCTNGIYLKINCDGLPISKSTNSQLWPIIGQVCNSTYCLPSNVNSLFLIGLYHGELKPNSSEEYLSEFIRELAEIFVDGLSFRSSNITVKIAMFICDAPARQFLKCIVSHNSYFGCERCIQKGTYKSTVVYPKIDCDLRSEESMIIQSQESHHKGVSPLISVGINLLQQFPLDPMHLVYLGVVRKLLHIWIKGPLQFRSAPAERKAISSYLMMISKLMPCEFARKPRSLHELERYKATEFRMFLLYTGPLCLIGNVDQNIYKNFLMLSVSIRILSSELISEFVDVAEKLLSNFVTHYIQIYGERHVVYNVHNLIHLTDDAKVFGSLEKFSAFPFENFLGKLKRQLRKPDKPLEQLVNRIKEQQLHDVTKFEQTHWPVLKCQHYEGPDGNFTGNQYSKIYFKNYCIKLDNVNDTVLMKNGHIAKVVNIIESNRHVTILYNTYLQKQHFFHYPIPSMKLDIYQVCDVGREIFSADVVDISVKFVRLPYQSPSKQKDKFVCFPLLHCEQL